MQANEITKDILVAIISKVQIPGGGDEQAVTKWVAEAYRIIHHAVLNPTKNEE